MKGHINRGRGDRTWYLRVELPRGADGKRRQRHETCTGTKVEAQRRLRELLREIETGMLAGDRHLTFADLAQRRLEATQHRVGARAFVNYRSYVERFIVPRLGTVRVEALFRTDLAQVYARERKSLAGRKPIDVGSERERNAEVVDAVRHDDIRSPALVPTAGRSRVRTTSSVSAKTP